MNYATSKHVLLLSLVLIGLLQPACLAQTSDSILDQRAKDLLLASKRVSSQLELTSFAQDCLKFIDEAVAAHKFSAAQKVATLAADSTSIIIIRVLPHGFRRKLCQTWSVATR